ncbi:MAG: phosphotransferase [Oligoflexales bacterium]
MILPEIEKNSINKFANELFGINSYVESLNSYAGQNYCLTDYNTGIKYVFKISEPEENFDNLAAQNAMMHHLSKKNLPVSIPLPVKSKNHQEIIQVPDLEENRYMRILTFLPGKFLCDLKMHPNQLLEQWGSSLAKVDIALKDFDHHGFRQDHIWDFQNIPEQMHKFEFCRHAQIRKILQYYFLEYINNVDHKLKKLKKVVIHNDGNDYNLLIKSGESHPSISGLIDFGDSVYSHHLNSIRKCKNNLAVQNSKQICA